MVAAFNALPCKPDHALIDGRPVRGFPIPQTAIIGGDGKSGVINAAGDSEECIQRDMDVCPVQAISWKK